MERTVTRADLNSEASSPDASPTSVYAKDLIPFEFIEQEAPQIEEHVEDEDEMKFCLFAPTPGIAKTAQPVSRIRLKSPTPTNAEPGLENPQRDPNYYFSKPLGPEERERFNASTVSGKDVKYRSCSFCPGSAYAWKVTDVRATKAEALILAKASSVYQDLLVQEPSKRKRPGKQMRIKSRTKLAMIKAAQIEDQKAAELREAAEREKRTTRNREKKAKKKSREKAKKAAGAVGAVGNDGSDGEDDDASSQPG